MEGEIRRERILSILTKSRQPIPGAELARQLEVSRQVIVQDITLIRAVNKNILSTNKGYIIYDPMKETQKARRTIAVRHTDAQTKDELYTIVDYGGKVLDVVIEHEIYGQIIVDLILKNRQDVDEFIGKLQKCQAKQLKTLTGDAHFHTVEADSERVLDAIEQKLKLKGYAE